MKNILNNEILSKRYKKLSYYIIFGIIILIISFFCIIAAFIEYSNAKENLQSLKQIINSQDKKLNRIAYVDVVGYYVFAIENNKLDYCITYDIERDYIMTMNDKDEEEFGKMFDEEGVTKVRYYGYTNKIPYDSKKYAIEAYNEEFEAELVNYDNFELVFGDVLLTVKKEKDVFGLDGFINIAGDLLFPGLIMLGIGIFLFLKGKIERRSYTRITELPDDMVEILEEEINKDNTIWFEKIKICLTDHYLIDYKNSVKVIRYEDIVWIYITEHTTNNLNDYNYLVIKTLDSDLNCGTGRTSSKKKREETYAYHHQIFDIVHNRNNNALIGFTAENKEEYDRIIDVYQNENDDSQ